MRYLVLSDIHGGVEPLEKALEYFDLFKCDYLVLLGDLLNHGPRNRLPDSYNTLKVVEILNRYSHRTIAVRGNCDSEVDSMMFNFPCNAPYAYIFIPVEGRIVRIFLTHGHLYHFKNSDDLNKIGLSSVDLVLSGHTHLSGIFKTGSGLININPGSLSLPKGGTTAGFGLISEDRVGLYDLGGELYAEHNFVFTNND